MNDSRGTEVLLRICRVGFCGSDLNTYRGLNPLVTYPRVPGHEIAGEIIARGGDVPETLKDGQLLTVLVFGCGMIGLGTIAAAALERGANVIAVDIDDTKLALARECGASHSVNSRSNGLKEAVLDLTICEGAGVTFEAVGSPITFKAAVQLAASAERIVYIGYAKEPVCYEANDFITKELDILGSRNATRSDFDRAIQMLKSGRYPAGKTVTITTPFEQSAAVLDDWSRNPAAVTKIHVTF